MRNLGADRSRLDLVYEFFPGTGLSYDAIVNLCTLALSELPDLLRETRWVGDLPRKLEKNGFSKIKAERFTLGISTIVSAEKQ